jgi:predicted protein tyrosine phosphatase
MQGKFMEQLIVSDVYEALKLAAENPNKFRIVSIISAAPFLRLVESPFVIPCAKEVLYLEFDDVTTQYLAVARDMKLRLATVEDCRQALEFLHKGGHCIVHCEAGISRSTGIALGYLLSCYRDYHKAVDTLFEIRPSADPNTHVLALMCKILNREQEYKDIMEYLEKIITHGLPYKPTIGSSKDTHDRGSGLNEM